MQLTDAVDFWTPKTSTKKPIRTNKQFESNVISIKSWIGKPGMLQSMGSQRVRHDWATEHQHLFCRKWQPDPKAHIEMQGNQNNQYILEKEEQSQKTHTSWFLNVLQSFSK